MLHLLDIFGDNQVDKTTSALATAALSSPAWLHYLQNVSDLFSILLPILGGLWLIIQMTIFLWRNFK